MHPGFVFLDDVLGAIRWDAKYATWDNAGDEGLGLLLWDGYRPQRAVDRFRAWADQPEDGRTKTRFYPRIERADMVAQGYVAHRSGHTRGSAVDLTLYRRDTGELLPMGGGHDLMDAVSHHGAPGVTEDEAARRGAESGRVLRLPARGMRGANR